MSIWSATLLKTYNRFRARINATSVTGISDVVLDHAQRAQDTLWSEKEWSPLIKRAALTVTDLVGTLPSDFGRFIVGGVYDDTNGDGRPDYYYYLNGDENHGYHWQNDFSDNTSAPALQIKFFNQPQTPYIAYVAKLPDLTDSGQYLFFPEDLMIAQMIFDWVTDRDKTDGNAYQAAVNRLTDAKRRFVNTVQYQNNSPITEIRGPDGHRAYQDLYNLDSGSDGNRFSEIDPDEHPVVR